jgi:hypothetical protein
MRLGDILSKSPKNEYVQVDGFLLNKKGNIGQQAQLSVGDIMLNYYCTRCDDTRTFISNGKLACIFVNKQIISIDSVLTCNCGTNVQVWFLIECEGDICGIAPKVRIIKRSEKLSANVRVNDARYGEFSFLLDMAERAYREGLGAGALVYLRKAFEKITIETAESINIDYPKYENGNPRNFYKLLEKVDEECSIIPKEFSSNGYELFRELSNVVHGEYDENLGLKKYGSLHRLVIGIFDNIKNNKELLNEIDSLGWNRMERDYD